ncbi:hypothetical protein [Streptomyces sp. NPDC048172]|uniref:bestrophin-like domain n=1 Tax=Streptomyces sp. NPDC048172 TaxID=3365505 RepID=UPI0037245F85
MLIATIVVAAGALALGIGLNRFLRGRVTDGDEPSVSVKDLVGPLQTLTVLVLAFSLVTAANSQNKADEAARSEAAAVDHLFETADHTSKEHRRHLQGDAVCYARAVQHREWPAMADGNGARATGVWSSAFREELDEIGTGDPVFSTLMAADNERSQARTQRLAESTQAIPSPVYWFVLILLALMVIAVAFCLPRRRNGAEVTTFIVITVLLTSTLLLIRDLEHPFDGVVKVGPTAMADIEKQMAHQYDEHFGSDAKLPCDRHGEPVRPHGD